MKREQTIGFIVISHLVVAAGAFFFYNLRAADVSQKHVIGTHGGHGLFSIFLGAVNNIYWADKNNKVPVVYWKENNLYFQPQGYNGADNPWEYYFQPVSHLSYEQGDAVHRAYEAPDGFMVPPNTYNERFHNLRVPLNQIIERYIKIRPEIMAKVDAFYDAHMAGKINIGIHIRGTDKKFETSVTDPEKLCATAREFGNPFPECQYLVATDEQRLLELAQKRLGSVISYDSVRSSDGWPVHYTREKVKQKDSAVLGEQVLVEALLLSRCHYFVHGASNVAAAAMLFNPWLMSTFVSLRPYKNWLIPVRHQNVRDGEGVIVHLRNRLLVVKG